MVISKRHNRRCELEIRLKMERVFAHQFKLKYCWTTKKVINDSSFVQSNNKENNVELFERIFAFVYIYILA